VAVEKLFSTKFAKIKLRQEIDFIGLPRPPNFGCWGRKASFSTPTPDYSNYRSTGPPLPCREQVRQAYNVAGFESQRKDSG
jgi:hypothetical protein